MVSKGKPDKIFKKCSLCKGSGILPWEIAKELPKPSRNLKCNRCKGKGFETAKPKK